MKRVIVTLCAAAFLTIAGFASVPLVASIASNNTVLFHQIVKNITPSSQIPAAETLSGDTDRPTTSTFVLGEAVRLAFHISGMAPAHPTLLTLRVSDEFGNSRTTLWVPVTSDDKGDASTIIDAPASRQGYYRVDAKLTDGTTLTTLGSRPGGFISYAIVPDPNARADRGIQQSRFGLQGGFNAQANVIPYLGVRWVLDGTGGWSALEPDHSGEFTANRNAAAKVGKARSTKRNGRVTYDDYAWSTYTISTVTVASLPHWAFDPATAGTICTTFGALNSAGVAAFPGFASAFAAAVATDLANQAVHYYQVTWEPASNWCFGGTPRQLVQMYQLAYSSIHQADPKAIVMGPTLFLADISPMRDLWSAGLGNFLDAVSMHPYVPWPPETNGLVAKIRTQMKMAQNTLGPNVPFMGTEHGYTSASIGELNEALGDIREAVVLLGEGFKVDFGFYVADFWPRSPTETVDTYGLYWNLNPHIDYGSDKLGPKPAAPAFAAMTFLLDGATSRGPLSNLVGTQMGYRFQRRGTNIFVLWDYASYSTIDNFVPVASSQICDWMGNCSNIPARGGNRRLRLGPSPIYVISQVSN